MTQMKALLLALAANVAVAGPARSEQDLPVLFHAYPLGYRFMSEAINASGQVVGADEQNLKGFVTGPGGKGVRLMGPAEKSTVALGINASGQVVGEIKGLDQTAKAFITDAATETLRVLVMPVPDYRYARVRGINDSGQVVGYYVVQPEIYGESTFTGFLSGPDGNDVRPIPGLNPEATTLAAVNNLGQVAGGSQELANGTSAQFVSGPNGEGLTQIDPAGARLISIRALNDSGQFGGSALFPPGKRAGNTTNTFVGEPGQPVRFKRNLGGIYGELLALNNLGDHVGYSTEPSGVKRAYFSTWNGKPVRLERFVSGLPEGVHLETALAINDRRQIAAYGSDHIGYIVCPTLNCD